ncbi:type IV pilus biogenesis protein PilM [Jeotgalibaca sp. A127]|uniref:type IV pilus biogenesis protein PilM n=1 Tax=Jeotgalibaca sp. A127 TaxID=3457324 RepID=UPI003FD63962
MLFQKKVFLYFEFLESRIRYLALDAQSKKIIEKNELQFETEIIHEGRIINPSLIQNRLQALITEKKWKNAKTSILLPDALITIREEVIPGQLTGSEVKEYLTLHIGQSIRSPFKNTSFHHEVTSQIENEQTVLLLLYPTDTIKDFENILTEASLKPDVADISSLCLYRMMQQNGVIQLGEEEHTLVLQWSPTHTSMMVFNKHLPQFARHSRNPAVSELWSLSPEGKWAWKGDQDTLQMSIKENLDTIERFLEFYRYSVLDGTTGITQIVLAGNFPHFEELKKNMENRFFLPILTISRPEEIASKYLPLYGLSLKNKPGKKMKRGDVTSV